MNICIIHSYYKSLSAIEYSLHEKHFFVVLPGVKACKNAADPSVWIRPRVSPPQKKVIQMENKWVFPQIMVPPKSSIFIGISIINHPFWGFPVYLVQHPNMKQILCKFLESRADNFNQSIQPRKIDYLLQVEVSPNYMYQLSVFWGCSWY